MVLRSLLLTSCLVLGVAGSASATTVTFNAGGTACANPGAGLCTSMTVASPNLIDFDTAAGLAPFVSGIATFSFSLGSLSPFVSGSIVDEFAAPPNDSTRYLSIGSPGGASSVTIDFSRPIGYYGLYFASADAYNTFAFYGTGNNDSPIASFTGDQLGASGLTVGQYINFFIADGSVSRIVLTSTSPALETDNHSYLQALEDFSDVPEPGTMGLLGSALIGVAFFARRRNQK
jgi:hypothetical protein